LSIIIVNAQEVPIANSFRFPLEGDWSPLWQDFGKWNNQWNGYHLGEDVGREDADTKNYAVYPMADGIVKFADIVMGYTVIIEHKLSNDDPDGDYVCSVYYHMKRPGEGGIKLTVGESVSMDSPIGYVSGKREDYKSSPHLHFGIRKGSYKDGKDTRTGFWYYPGYTTIKKDGVVQKNPDDPIHKQILADWFNPTADKPGFIERHITQIEQSTIGSSLYHIECSKPMASSYKEASLRISVNGPADELALMLTNPKGKTDIKFISKRSLIDNFETVDLKMGEEPFSEGPYTLTVKTVTPEKIIYKKDMWFSSPKNVQMTNGEVTLKCMYDTNRKNYHYNVLKYNLAFKNEGSLPFFIDKLIIVFIMPDKKVEYTLPYYIPVPSGGFIFNESANFWFWNDNPCNKTKTINVITKLYKNGKIILTFPMKLIIEK
jgi:murein DD-endopeptidase MepM/ murein hydrolase activator NlpD